MYIILEKYTYKYVLIIYQPYRNFRLAYNVVIKTPESRPIVFIVFVYIFKHFVEGKIQPGPERLNPLCRPTFVKGNVEPGTEMDKSDAGLVLVCSDAQNVQ